MKWDIERVMEAWKLASSQHDGQKYGGENEGEHIEYLHHIGSVTLEILHALQHEQDLDADLAILCAILHDTVEDTALQQADIRQRFGKQVAAGVLALSKDESLQSKQDMMRDSLDRITRQPREVAMVKLADRICNLSGPPYYWNDDKKRKYVEEAKMIHERLAYASTYLANRLEEKISRYVKFTGKE